MQETGTGKLSVVATPIGNLEDITLRALRILKEADVVACEDTRMTKKLLTHFDIHTPTTSFSAQSGERGFEKIIALLQEGKHVALVSDAGTPGVSDPGLELVSRIREQNLFKENGLAEVRQKADEEIRGPFRKKDFADVAIEAIPGPSALAAALSVSGLRAASFTFYGFLPLKKGRETVFKEIAASERASVFYESPHRIMKALESLQKFLNDPSFANATAGKTVRRVGVFRELTKIYEEHVVGSIDEVLEHFKTNPDRIRGEFVVIIEGEF
jgi:16S rRNA (cytidine1402-2'-O)-methyltransferase